MKDDLPIELTGQSRWNRHRLLTILATVVALAFFAAACTSDDTAVQPEEAEPSATSVEEDDEPDETVSLTQADADGPETLAYCFASSIDAIGRGSLEDGIAGFDDCLTDDYVFEFQFAPGAPAVVCPGADCPVQDFSSIGEMRALFANGFFVNSGYVATQHQILNIEVDTSGETAEVVAYIQAQHFLPDNSVDIAWNDYHYTAVVDDGQWKMATETIVGTAFLNFQGRIVGGDDASEGSLSSVGEVTLRNTLEDPGEAEATFPSLFGQPDDAFDEFAQFSVTETEFPTALAQDGTPAGDLSGLYSIDIMQGSIAFEVVAAADDPFWSGVFGLFPDGKVDRYYFTFDQPHGVSGFTSDNPNLNVRIDSDTVLVIELTGGYDLQSGVSFTVDLIP